MKQEVDRKRSDREFTVGERVYLRLKHSHLKSITRGQVSKLSPRYYGPFTIVAKVGKVAYRLQLLEESQIHPVFNVSLLKKAMGTELVNTTLPSLPREENRMEEPEAILDRRVIYNYGAPLIQVLVKWKE